MAASSPESMPEKPLNFSAPPPSPIASGRRSCVTNDEVLTEFLEHSLRVPDLILPDNVFPRQKFIENPPRIDFQSLKSMQSDAVSQLVDSIAEIGCFQLVNYEISSEIMNSAMNTAGGVFRVSPEKRTAVTRSPEKPYGFEEVHAVEKEEESELVEEFVWCRDDESLKLQMEGIWPLGYSKFCEKIETIMLQMEKVAEKILQVMMEHSERMSVSGNYVVLQENVGSVCYVYKQCRNVAAETSSLRYDVIRMLIRGVDFSHAVCLHICDGASEFHVYSKRGWVSFAPDSDAIIITTGDQVQGMSGGQLKHVIGRPIFRNCDKEDCVSMAVLYSPPSISSSKCNPHRGSKTIYLAQQAIAAVILTLLYHFLVFVCNTF